MVEQNSNRKVKVDRRPIGPQASFGMYVEPRTDIPPIPEIKIASDSKNNETTKPNVAISQLRRRFPQGFFSATNAYLDRSLED